MNKNRKRQKGFTLIELIVVIAILAILGMIAIPRLANVQSNSRIEADRSTARQIVNMAKIYIADLNYTNTEAATAGNVDVADLVSGGLLDVAPVAQVNDTAFVLAVNEIAAATGVPAHLKFVVSANSVNVYDSEDTTAPFGALDVFIKSAGN